MNRREAERLTHQQNALMSLGFTPDEAESLRRISMTLRRWHERECGDGNGCIERDEETGRAYWLNAYSGRRYAIPDRERGAKKRLGLILKARNDRAGRDKVHEPYFSWAVREYIQTDPRGAALYILRPGDVPEGEDAGAFYNRGICVY